MLQPGFGTGPLSYSGSRVVNGTFNNTPPGGAMHQAEQTREFERFDAMLRGKSPGPVRAPWTGSSSQNGLPPPHVPEWGSKSSAARDGYMPLGVVDSSSARMISTSDSGMPGSFPFQGQAYPANPASPQFSGSFGGHVTEPTQQAAPARMNLMPSPSTRSSCIPCLDVNSDRFNLCIGVVIVLNSILIGFETDLPDSKVFAVFNHSFNAIFLVEMLLRISQLGLSYFKAAWNLFDCLLVFTGTLDLWIMPIFFSGQSLGAAKMMRLLRVCRILRVIRIFRLFKELTLIAQAFANAFTSVCWIGILMIIMDYVFAIFLTQMVGWKADLWEGDESEMVDEWFGTIGNSMYSLFMIMTLANWDSICNIVMKQYPSAVIFFIFYIILASYTMVSLITGVISESLINAQRDDAQFKIMAFNQSRQEICDTLLEIFKTVDIDASHSISKAEIQRAWSHAEIFEKLKTLNLDVFDLKGLLELFDSIWQSKTKGQERYADHDERSIPIDDFVNSLAALHGGASMKSMFLLQQEVKQVHSRQDEMAEEVQILHDNHAEMLQAIRDLNSNVARLAGQLDGRAQH